MDKKKKIAEDDEADDVRDKDTIPRKPKGGMGNINWIGQQNKIKQQALENKDETYISLSKELEDLEESLKSSTAKVKKQIKKDMKAKKQVIEEHMNFSYPDYKIQSEKIRLKENFEENHVIRSKSLRLKPNAEQAFILRNMLINSAILHDKVLAFLNSNYNLNDPEVLAELTKKELNKIKAECLEKFIKNPSDHDKIHRRVSQLR